MKELQKDHGMGQVYQIPFILLFFLVGVVCNPNTTQDYPILTVEEINSVHCMGTPQPYEGPPQLQSLLSEMYIASNGKFTYYIFPLEKIIQVNNLNSKDKSCAGVFSGFKTDPYNNKEISLNYQSGDYCPGHRLKSTELVIHCDRSTSSMLDVYQVSELNQCESEIQSKSPTPCMISRKGPSQVSLEDIENRLEDIQDRIDILQRKIYYILNE